MTHCSSDIYEVELVKVYNIIIAELMFMLRMLVNWLNCSKLMFRRIQNYCKKKKK